MVGLVERDENRAWITGMESAFWGGTSDQQNSVMGALTAAFQAMGVDAGYEFLMGVSGAAFRLQFNWCPSAPHAECGRHCTQPALEALGYEVYWITTRDQGDELPDGVAEAQAALVATIDEGKPALLSSEECGLIVGYVNDGQRFLIRPYSAEFTSQKQGYATMTQWPWAVGILSAKGEPPSRWESVRQSLAAAIEMAHTPSYGNYTSGFAAYERWATELLDEARFADLDSGNWHSLALGNGYTYGCLADARLAAGKYLYAVAAECEEAVATPLTEAAQFYERIHKTMWRKRPELPCPWSLMPWDLKAPENWTPAMRQAQSHVLRQLWGLELEGVAALERSLAAMSLDGSA